MKNPHIKKRPEKRVKFQISGILVSDIIRAQQKALNQRISLSSALRDMIVRFGCSGDQEGQSSLPDEASRFVDYRLQANKMTKTPVHVRKRVQNRIDKFTETPDIGVEGAETVEPLGTDFSGDSGQQSPDIDFWGEEQFPDNEKHDPPVDYKKIIRDAEHEKLLADVDVARKKMFDQAKERLVNSRGYIDENITSGHDVHQSQDINFSTGNNFSDNEKSLDHQAHDQPKKHVNKRRYFKTRPLSDYRD